MDASAISVAICSRFSCQYFEAMWFFREFSDQSKFLIGWSFVDSGWSLSDSIEAQDSSKNAFEFSINSHQIKFTVIEFISHHTIQTIQLTASAPLKTIPVPPKRNYINALLIWEKSTMKAWNCILNTVTWLKFDKRMRKC